MKLPGTSVSDDQSMAAASGAGSSGRIRSAASPGAAKTALNRASCGVATGCVPCGLRGVAGYSDHRDPPPSTATEIDCFRAIGGPLLARLGVDLRARADLDILVPRLADGLLSC